MFVCENCGTELDYLGGGGCGGRGSVYGCPNCEIFFEQITGGLLATPGGEEIRRVAGHYKPARKPEVEPPDFGVCTG